MSYRTFKRVLGETNLERKCRWWFGLSLVVLLTLSFTWYGRRTDKLVDDRIKTLSEELVRAGWQKLHIEKLAEIEKLLRLGSDEPASRRDSLCELADSSEDLGREFEWHALLPARRTASPSIERRGLPSATMPKKRSWLHEWLGSCSSGSRQTPDAPEAWQAARSFSRSEHDIDGRRVYQYYQPMYANDSRASKCHKAIGRGAESTTEGRRPDGGRPRDDRRPGNRRRAGQEPGRSCGPRPSSSAFSRCSRCGPSCGT